MGDKLNHFNLRVYGIFINERAEVLVSDEYILNRHMTKFPGGGLEFGEGTLDCLKREAMEEFGQTIEIVDHFYTTDFFQKALFYDDHQLISIYYLCKFMTPPMFKISSVPFDFKPVNGAQSFRYVNIKSTSVEELSFPVDRVVFEMLKKKQINKAL